MEDADEDPRGVSILPGPNLISVRCRKMEGKSGEGTRGGCGWNKSRDRCESRFSLGIRVVVRVRSGEGLGEESGVRAGGGSA